ncbi:TfoX/Sxy family protein [Rubrolithibacter danxiaensis]|uniref:TfoX/Sxy family protein n=1 Tax=Rubrolithibacter danxiaensis TaxID=3390805 RepID=UPI003BF87AA5
MAYYIHLENRIRACLAKLPELKIEEKKMFRGLTFMVNDKMCVGVSGENLMCRFDPVLQGEVAGKSGFEPMIMRGKKLNGYCYVNPQGLKSDKDLEYWINLCLDFNEKAKSSRKNK